jgi:TctA family transporter
VLAWFLEANDYPIAPLILGMLLGTMLEEHFIRSMIKAEGDFLVFVERPIAAGLAIFIALLWGGSAYLALRRSSITRAAQRAAVSG